MLLKQQHLNLGLQQQQKQHQQQQQQPNKTTSKQLGCDLIVISLFFWVKFGHQLVFDQTLYDFSVKLHEE